MLSLTVKHDIFLHVFFFTLLADIVVLCFFFLPVKVDQATSFGKFVHEASIFYYSHILFGIICTITPHT